MSVNATSAIEFCRLIADGADHGPWDWIGASWSFLLGVVAILGGVVALQSFLASRQASSHAHMHQMFLRYLDARDRLSKRLTEDARSPRPISSLREDLDFGGSALYFLEEVFAWTVTEETDLKRWWVKYLLSARERAKRQDVIASWRATVTTQLITNRGDVLPSLKGYTSCYGLPFLSFAADCLNDVSLSLTAHLSKLAVKNRKDRPLGFAERAQRKAISGIPPS